MYANKTTTTTIPQFGRPAFDLKTECNRRGILVPNDNPSPTEIIPILEQAIAAHKNHPARFEHHASRAISDWKATLDDLQRFLTKLRGADSSANPASATESNVPQNFSLKKPAQSDPTVANQRSSGDPKVIQGDPEVIQSDPRLASSDPCSPKSAPDHQPSSPVADDADEEDDDSEHQEQDELDEEEDFNIFDYLDDEVAEAALDLREHLSGRSPLDKLQPRDQRAILRLLEDHEPDFVAKAIAEPPPVGLGVQTSSASLKRFRRRCHGAKEDAQKAQHAKAIEDLMVKAHDTDEVFQAAVQRLLKTRLLAKTSEPNFDLAEIHSLINSITKLRRQTLAERKQMHAEASK